MTPDEDSEELKNSNADIISRFKKMDFDPQAKVKNRIWNGLSRPGRQYIAAASGIKYKAAFGIAAAVLVVMFMRRQSPVKPELNPDWRSYYNFPSRGEEVMAYIKQVPPDWRAYYRFPGYR